MLSGPNSVPADRCETAVLKATTAAYFRAGYDPLFTIFPMLNGEYSASGQKQRGCWTSQSISGSG